MVVQPERWPNKFCLSSKLTPAALGLLLNVCFRSWTLTCSRSADFLARIHAVFSMRVMGVLLQLKTCSVFLPRCLLTMLLAMVLSNQSLVSVLYVLAGYEEIR